MAKRRRRKTVVVEDAPDHSMLIGKLVEGMNTLKDSMSDVVDEVKGIGQTVAGVVHDVAEIKHDMQAVQADTADYRLRRAKVSGALTASKYWLWGIRGTVGAGLSAAAIVFFKYILPAIQSGPAVAGSY